MNPSGDANSAATTDIERFFDQWSAAIVSNDVDRIAAFTTEDWILVDRPGVITRDGFHAVVSTGELQHTSMEHEILEVRHHGEVTVVLTRGRNTAIFRGETHQADEWTSNLLIEEPGGLRCVLTQLTPVPSQQ